MLPALALVLAALIFMTFGAQAADLVVWWEKGFFPQADEAVTEIVAAFEQDTGKEVELVQPEQAEIQAKGRGSARCQTAARLSVQQPQSTLDPPMGSRRPVHQP